MESRVPVNTRLSQVLVVVAALLAFLPVLAVDLVLDSYIREHEGERMHRQISALAMDTQSAVYDGISSMREVVASSPSLCAPTFVTNIQKQLQSNMYLRQVLVENLDGVQYCDGYGDTLAYTSLSAEIAIPGAAETLKVVRFAGEELPSLKIIQRVGARRILSAFVYFNPALVRGMPSELSEAAVLTFQITDGTDIAIFGDSTLLENGVSDEYLYQSLIADALPISIEVAVPMGAVRMGYETLHVAVTMIATLTCAAFLILAITYLRQVRMSGINLQRGIVKGELLPYYQPVMDIVTGELTGCEVLVRWKRNGKLVPPDEFIDYAETSGLAIPMTIKLMEQVVTDLSDLCAEQPDLKIGINLFDGHFNDTIIVEDVQAIFEDTPIGYRQLMFEITERRPLENQLAVDGVIGGLHALGCKIAMDDAGTGYSNLKTVQTLGIDVVKIDRVFVELIEPDTESVPVLDALITMANDLGMGIIAEGVETESQAIYLRARGVVSAQGFLFAPALNLSAFLQLAQALGPKRKTRKPANLSDDTDEKAA